MQTDQKKEIEVQSEYDRSSFSGFPDDSSIQSVLYFEMHQESTLKKLSKSGSVTLTYHAHRASFSIETSKSMREVVSSSTKERF